MSLWRRLVTTYVSFCVRRPGAIVSVALLLSALCISYAVNNIRIVTDLGALLPENTPSVKALDLSRERIGSTDFFTIAIESNTQNARAVATAQDVIKRRIETEWSDASWVQVDRDTSFFKTHALYYLPKDELIGLYAALEEELLKQSADKLPGLVNLLDADQQRDTGISGWYSEDIPRRLGLPPQVCAAFNQFFKTDPPPNTGDKAGKPTDLADRLIGPKGDVGVVLVQLARPSTDLDYARFALTRGADLLASVKLHEIDPSLRAQVVGAYRSFMEVDAVARDGQTATLLSVLLILIVIIASFRSLRTLVAVFVPLVVAASFTMALVAATYGRLTLLTVFILALLAGMGIDYGIHLFGRILQDRRRGSDLSTALIAALSETGSALAAAGLTTIASLSMLLLAHFKGFREFSVIACFGLAFCLLAALLLIPPLVVLLERLRPVRPVDNIEATTAEPSTLLRRAIRPAFWVGLAVTIVLAIFVSRATFEYDFRNLRAPSTGGTIGYGRAIGKDASTTPAVILAESQQQMKAVHDFLHKRLTVEHDPTLMSFITLYTFVPEAEVQQKRQTLILKIGKLVNKKAFDRIEGDNARLISCLRSMTQAEPFTVEQLPEWTRKIVSEQNGEIGRVGHLYAKVEDWNAYSVQAFQARYGFLEFDGQWLPIANSRFILADIVRMVRHDGGRLGLWVALVLVGILAVYTRSLRGTVLLSLVIAAAVVWTIGLMGLLDIRLGLYNLIAIPVMLGVGIDGAIHLYHRHRINGPDHIERTIRETGLTISASSLTTMAGFTGLIFVNHLGLQTIGVLAVIGVGLCWAAVMLLLPYLLLRFVAEAETHNRANSR